MPSSSRPRVADRLVDEVAVVCPVSVRRAGEQVLDTRPRPPLPGAGSHQASSLAAGHGDRDFFSSLDPAHQLGGLLTQLAQTDSRHPLIVALVLPVLLMMTPRAGRAEGPGIGDGPGPVMTNQPPGRTALDLPPRVHVAIRR